MLSMITPSIRFIQPSYICFTEAGNKGTDCVSEYD